MHETNPYDENNNRYSIIAGIAFFAILFLIALYLYGNQITRDSRLTDISVEGPSLSEIRNSNDLATIEDDIQNFNPAELETTDAEVEAVLEESES